MTRQLISKTMKPLKYSASAPYDSDDGAADAIDYVGGGGGSFSGNSGSFSIMKPGQGDYIVRAKIAPIWTEYWDAGFCGTHSWNWVYRALPADTQDGSCEPKPGTLAISGDALNCTLDTNENTYILISGAGAVGQFDECEIDISVTGFDEGGDWDEHDGSDYVSALYLHVYGDSNIEQAISGPATIDVSSLGTIWLVRIVAQGSGSYSLNSIIFRIKV